jgi:23S rRNA pseudouridine2457 synthase
MLIAFHKPFGVLSQFTAEAPGQGTLAKFGFPLGVYPLGRLDSDSEGLLLLTDEPKLNQALLEPRQGHRRRYWAQVERIPLPADLARLSFGIRIGGRVTLPCRAWLLEPQPEPAPRNPPIRYRKTVPTSWVALELVEGKNRQVRRMTAAIGFPTLRLIRVQIGQFPLQPLSGGEWKIIGPDERQLVFA